VTISNGLATIASNFTIVVACQLNLARLAPKLSFARTNSDSCTITGAFDLPANTSFAGKLATLDIGGGSLTFYPPEQRQCTQWPKQVQHADLQQEDRPVEAQCLVQERFLANRMGELRDD